MIPILDPERARLVPRLPPRLMAALDELLLDNGRMRCLDAAMLRAFPHAALQSWAQMRGRYQFPTTELVLWLSARIAGRKCVEVGAGHGDIGRNVGGVTLTDSYFQASEAMRLYYEANDTQAITPPPEVMRREALAAAMRYQPEVCLACWVTQAYEPGDEESKTGSCVGGVRWDELLHYVGELVFVGNLAVHGTMRLLALPHEEFAPDWLVSRAHDQSLNRIWVWKGNGGRQ